MRAIPARLFRLHVSTRTAPMRRAPCMVCPDECRTCVCVHGHRSDES